MPQVSRRLLASLVLLLAALVAWPLTFSAPGWSAPVAVAGPIEQPAILNNTIWG